MACYTCFETGVTSRERVASGVPAFFNVQGVLELRLIESRDSDQIEIKIGTFDPHRDVYSHNGRAHQLGRTQCQ